jgi:hypothetical protein
MASKSKNYIWQWVIGLGFLSGVWTTIGIDPGQIVIGALSSAIDTLYPDPGIRYLFILLPTILLLLSIYGAYAKGKIPGLISVVVAYFAGLLVLSSTFPALLLLLIAIIIGWIATNRKLVKKLTGH